MKNFQPQCSSAYAFLFVSTLVLLNGCFGSTSRWSEMGSGMIRTVTNRGGQTLGYATTSGISLLTADGFAFKDLNKNGALDPYEDWRLSADERARDLASKMSVEQIAGLMLYSAHQAIPAAGGWLRATYDGKPFTESGANAWDLSDAQKDFLTNDNLRHVLITSVESPEVAARWNNNVQALVEGIGLGIPANNSSDPRHRTQPDAEYNAGSGGDISMWPGAIGRFERISCARHHDGPFSTGRSGHRTPLVPFERHLRGRSRPRDRHGPRVCGWVSDLRGRRGHRRRLGL